MRAIIVDSTELFDEILQRVRQSREFRLIDAAHACRVRLFAAKHVASEVPAKILQHFSRRGATPEAGLHVWESEYLPYVHFVNTAGLQTESKDLQLLSQRDPSDLAQARLTTLLSPVLALSSDKDLIDHGFALKSRWAVAHSTRLQLEAEAGFMTVALPGGLVWAGFESAFRSSGTLWGRPGKLLVSATALGSLWFTIRAARKAKPATRAKLLDVVESVMCLLSDAAEKQKRAEQGIAGFLVTAPGMDEPLVADMASVLARAVEPLTATEISREVWADDGPIPNSFFTDVQNLLARLPAFVQVGQHGWELGSTRAAT